MYIDKNRENEVLELGIAQAQTQFTKLLNQTVIIVDKKAHQKKAVIMPYEEYAKLIAKNTTKEMLENGSFNKFAGVLDSDFQTDDIRYQAIVK